MPDPYVGYDGKRKPLGRKGKVLLSILAVPVVLFVILAFFAYIDVRPGTNNLSPRDTGWINIGLMQEVRDPYSLKTGGMIAKEPHHYTMVCGWLNAKNGLGAYVGAVPFSGGLDRDAENFRNIIIGTNAGSREFVLKICTDEGLHLDN